MAKKTLPKKTLDALRRALVEEREQLVAQASDLDAEADISKWRDGGFDDDPADTGSANVERERAQSLASHARKVLVQIDDALARMDDGTYGTCQRCETLIDADRLDAIPYTTLCMACKRLDEHGR
ncbi:MAG: TraR/DksA family transcriptional regulator [Actinomycetes bacterium]